MSTRYLIPSTDFHRAETTIKRSRFIVTMAHAPDIETARLFISLIREEFPDATHNCWAFQCGPPADTAKVGMSDDGEPSGTAGKPMLNTLLHADVGELAVVVTRYFGGTKLGTGGLVRAYTDLVKLGLEELPVRERVETMLLHVELDYSFLTLFKRLFSTYEVDVTSETFDTRCRFELLLPCEHVDAFTGEVTEMTHGKAIITPA